jgi:AraC-like DNA-binding protein
MVGATELLAEQLAAVSSRRLLPMLVLLGEQPVPLSYLQLVLRANPRAVVLRGGSERQSARVRSFLHHPAPVCATGQVLAALPPRGDRVTQSMLTQIAVESRRGLSTAALASAHRMSASAVRARFARAGLAAPRDVSTVARALHALWYLLKTPLRASVVAQRMNLGSRANVLERVRTATGRSFRGWRECGGFEAALAAGMRQLITEPTRD